MTSSTELEPYRGDGFALSLPPSWTQLVEPDVDRVELIALEPERDPEVFRANVVVTVDDIDSAEQWQEAAVPALAEQLNDFILLDEQQHGPVVRRLFHHDVPESGAVTAEQWTWPAGNHGFTVTTSAATFDYDNQADLFATIASTFRPEGQRA